MTKCEACGAELGPTATWCGQCFAPVGARDAVPATLAPSREIVPGPLVDRFGIPMAPSTAPPTAAPSPPISAIPRQHPGWRPPVESCLPVPPPSNTIGSKRALVVTAGAIGLGAVMQAAFWALQHAQKLEPETLVRYSLVATFTFYVIVLALVLRQVQPHVVLRWATRSKLSALLIGPLVGAGLAGAMLGLAYAAVHHLSTDPTIALLVSEGDPAHILMTVLITCVAAPFVEELLFRGLLLQALREKSGTKLAMVVSACAFSAWHLRPQALRYYVFMGLILGLLYVKRGLLCSMSAHAAFNGTLTAAAVALALSPGTTVTAGALTVDVPGGWHQVTDSRLNRAPDATVLTGPSGAAVVINPEHDGPSHGFDAERLAEVIRSGALDGRIPGVQLDDATAHTLLLPAGPAVEVDVTSEGHRGEYVGVLAPDDIYDVVFISAGSVRAEHDFARMLTSVRTEHPAAATTR